MLIHSLFRHVLRLLTHAIYRIQVEGSDNIPAKGGALLVSNHLSFADFALIMASTKRYIRFLMLTEIYERPLVKPFARLMRAIPLSPEQSPRAMIKSLQEASDLIKAGELVCIFAEGQITRIGQLLPFHRGFERILKGVYTPIIPVCLEGVWGSIFSFEGEKFFWKLPRRIPYPVTVSFGYPLPPTSTANEVRRAVQELQCETFRQRRLHMQTLSREIVRTARRHPFRFSMADARVSNLPFCGLLVRTLFIARRLGKIWEGKNMVGILLPPSVPAALVNLSALLMGKIPVNLNYTAADETIASSATQCEIDTVVTSKAFLDSVHLQVPGKAVLIEELAEKPRLSEKLSAFLMAWLFPVGLLERVLGQNRTITLDDVATVIFTSGTTGDPKGVMLTHYNIASNVEQVRQVFPLECKDRLLGILPFFHSFGFTGTLVLPVLTGIGVVYHPNPLDARAIGALASQYSITLLIATPTFLQTYTRRCEPEQFGSLRFVFAGAEKLPERVASAFEDRFGIRPLEAYGCTECAPAVTINIPDYRAAGFRQVGAKRGSIGRPLPGISIRIVDPETMQPIPAGRSGLMLVRGPNVMKGYLGRPGKTAEVLRDGWYMTGDIATLDEDGFLNITDRLSRFSKIGGEMVPHVKVEDKLQELAGLVDRALVVTGVPDRKKGERLIVLHTLSDEQRQAVLEKLRQIDLPELWIPHPTQFFRVTSIPLLGTGKPDFRKIRELALQLSGAP